METIEAFNYMKKIIKKGIDNEHTDGKIRNNLYMYLHELIVTKAITSEEAKTLKFVVKNLDCVLEGKKSIDEIYVESLSIAKGLEYEELVCEKKKVTRTNTSARQSKPHSYEDTGIYIPPELRGMTYNCGRELLAEIDRLKREKNTPRESSRCAR